jgi:hypothetical protein
MLCFPARHRIAPRTNNIGPDRNHFKAGSEKHPPEAALTRRLVMRDD